MTELPEIVIWSWSFGFFILGYIWAKNKFKK